MSDSAVTSSDRLETIVICLLAGWLAGWLCYVVLAWTLAHCHLSQLLPLCGNDVDLWLVVTSG